MARTATSKRPRSAGATASRTTARASSASGASPSSRATGDDQVHSPLIASHCQRPMLSAAGIAAGIADPPTLGPVVVRVPLLVLDRIRDNRDVGPKPLPVST